MWRLLPICNCSDLLELSTAFLTDQLKAVQNASIACGPLRVDIRLYYMHIHRRSKFSRNQQLSAHLLHLLEQILNKV